MSKPARKLLFIFLGLNTLVIGAVFALSYFLIQPIEALSKEIITARTELEATRRQQSSIRNWQKMFDEQFKDYEILFTESFSGEEVVKFVSQLEKIAEENKVTQTITFKDPPKKKKKVNKKTGKQAKTNPSTQTNIYYNLTLEAEFVDLMNYLYAYESLNSYPSITSLQIDIQEEKNPENRKETIIIPKLRALLAGEAKPFK